MAEEQTLPSKCRRGKRVCSRDADATRRATLAVAPTEAPASPRPRASPAPYLAWGASSLAGWPGVKQQELQLKYAERRLMIEKGLPVQDEAPKPPLVRLDYLRRGIVSCCLGLGLLLGYVF